MVNAPASACHADAVLSYQVNDRASSGTVTWRVSPGIERYARKPLQFLRRPRHAGMVLAHINLRHIGAGAASRVADVKAHVVGSGCACRMNLEIRILEAGVREPVTKREQRLDPVMFVAAVAHKNIVLIRNLQRARRRVVIVNRRIVFQAAFPADRQTSRRVHIAHQHFGKRRPPFLSGIPVLQQRRHLDPPRRSIHAAA